MIPLAAKLLTGWDAEPFVARIRGASRRDADSRELPSANVSASAVWVSLANHSGNSCREIRVPEELAYLSDGDVVCINPRRSEIWVVYRRASTSNSLLLTEQCNSYCVMCSQPPKSGPDGFLVDVALSAIPLFDRATAEIGLTGGEPTLLGDRLFEVLDCLRTNLPETAVHMLSNGRRFSDLAFTAEFSRHLPADFMAGIPLYSDLAYTHDFVVQAANAFDETIRGILNLACCQVPVEIRVVVQAANAGRLIELSEFLVRNLPFVAHVAFMGLEMMGFARPNAEAIWIDPAEYRDRLAAATRLLSDAGIPVSVYNHQLCTLDRSLWPFARKSISDWKREYLPECAECAVQQECGGFFFSSMSRRSRLIGPIGESEC